MEWDLRPIRGHYRNGFDRLKALTVLGQQTQHQRELPLPFKDFGGLLAANRGLHNGVDVPDRKTVAGTAGTVHFNQNVRLSQLLEDPDVLNTPYGGELPRDGVSGGGEHLQVRAKELDGILAFDTRDGLLNIVLNVL